MRWPETSVGHHYKIVGLAKAGMMPKEIARAMDVELSSVYQILKRATKRGGVLETAPRKGRLVIQQYRPNIDRVRKRIGMIGGGHGQEDDAEEPGEANKSH